MADRQYSPASNVVVERVQIAKRRLSVESSSELRDSIRRKFAQWSSPRAGATLVGTPADGRPRSDSDTTRLDDGIFSDSASTGSRDELSTGSEPPRPGGMQPAADTDTATPSPSPAALAWRFGFPQQLPQSAPDEHAALPHAEQQHQPQIEQQLPQQPGVAPRMTPAEVISNDRLELLLGTRLPPTSLLHMHNRRPSANSYKPPLRRSRLKSSVSTSDLPPTPSDNVAMMRSVERLLCPLPPGMAQFGASNISNSSPDLLAPPTSTVAPISTTLSAAPAAPASSAASSAATASDSSSSPLQFFSAAVAPAAVAAIPLDAASSSSSSAAAAAASAPPSSVVYFGTPSAVTSSSSSPSSWESSYPAQQQHQPPLQLSFPVANSALDHIIANNAALSTDSVMRTSGTYPFGMETAPMQTAKMSQ